MGKFFKTAETERIQITSEDWNDYRNRKGLQRVGIAGGVFGSLGFAAGAAQPGLGKGFKPRGKAGLLSAAIVGGGAGLLGAISHGSKNTKRKDFESLIKSKVPPSSRITGIETN